MGEQKGEQVECKIFAASTDVAHDSVVLGDHLWFHARQQKGIGYHGTPVRQLNVLEK